MYLFLPDNRCLFSDIFNVKQGQNLFKKKVARQKNNNGTIVQRLKVLTISNLVENFFDEIDWEELKDHEVYDKKDIISPENFLNTNCYVLSNIGKIKGMSLHFQGKLFQDVINQTKYEDRKYDGIIATNHLFFIKPREIVTTSFSSCPFYLHNIIDLHVQKLIEDSNKKEKELSIEKSNKDTDREEVIMHRITKKILEQEYLTPDYFNEDNIIEYKKLFDEWVVSSEVLKKIEQRIDEFNNKYLINKK